MINFRPHAIIAIVLGHNGEAEKRALAESFPFTLMDTCDGLVRTLDV